MNRHHRTPWSRIWRQLVNRLAVINLSYATTLTLGDFSQKSQNFPLLPIFCPSPKKGSLGIGYQRWRSKSEWWCNRDERKFDNNFHLSDRRMDRRANGHGTTTNTALTRSVSQLKPYYLPVFVFKCSREHLLSGTKVRSQERKFPGSFVHGSESSQWVLSLRGAKIPGSEKSLNPVSTKKC